MSQSTGPGTALGSDRDPLKAGYTDIPSGHIAAIATSLEMRARPEAMAMDGACPLALRHVETPAVDWYRDLFRRIGTPWLWQSRLRLSDDDLAKILTDDDVEVWAASTDTGDVGLVELDFREKDACELAFFGLTADWTGRGVGRDLMHHAISRAWARPIKTFWVHTCTLDHPSALAFYVRSGFTPFKLQAEVSPDPRLDGTLPHDARPSLPIIR